MTSDLVFKPKEVQLSLKPGKVYRDILQLCSEIDTTALNLLEKNYKAGGKGVILNVDEELNLQLQVSVFLGALNDTKKSKLNVLVLCPDDLILKWHYYLSLCGRFCITVATTKSRNCSVNYNKFGNTGVNGLYIAKFDQLSSHILILGFSHINLLKYQNKPFGSVIIDSFDEVASRVLIRKLHGKFYNIAITYRDFYEHPDQKLQWKMVGWLGPAGVQNHFNVKKYRHVWSYIARKNNFLEPVTEKQKFWSILKQWSKEHNLYHLISKYEQKPKNLGNSINIYNTINRVVADSATVANIENTINRVEGESLRKISLNNIDNTINSVIAEATEPQEVIKQNELIKHHHYIEKSLNALDDFVREVDTFFENEANIEDQLNRSPENDINRTDKSKNASEPIKHHDIKRSLNALDDFVKEVDSFFNNDENKANIKDTINGSAKNMIDGPKNASEPVKNNKLTMDVLDNFEDNFVDDVGDFFKSISNSTANGDISHKSQVSYQDIVKSEQKILNIASSSESDLFFKNLCCNRSNNLVPDNSVSNVTLEVDNLIAEVMEIVQK